MKKKVVRSYSFSERHRKTFDGSFRAPSKNRFSLIWRLLAIFFVLVLAVFFFLCSSFFHIKTTEIEGLKNTDYQEVKDLLLKQEEEKFLFFSGKNLLLFNKNKLISSLNEFNFVKIEVKKQWWKRSLLLKIEERQSAIIFRENGRYFLADQDGNIINSHPDCENLKRHLEVVEVRDSDTTTTTTLEINPLENPDQSDCLNLDDTYRRENPYPLIENFAAEKVKEDQKKINLDSGYIDFCLNIYNDLDENSGFGLKSFILDEESYNSVKIKLNNGLEVYFNLKNDYKEQIGNFFTLKNEIKSQLEGKKYIDLRYGDKIFYY